MDMSPGTSISTWAMMHKKTKLKNPMSRAHLSNLSHIWISWRSLQQIFSFGSNAPNRVTRLYLFLRLGNDTLLKSVQLPLSRHQLLSVSIVCQHVRLRCRSSPPTRSRWYYLIINLKHKKRKTMNPSCPPFNDYFLVSVLSSCIIILEMHRPHWLTQVSKF